MLLPLGACGLNKVAMAPEVPYDYHERHPIVLAETPHVIDIFPPAFGSRLDQENILRIREFVTRYRRIGHGMITVLAPTGGSDPTALRAGAEKVRRALEAEGVGRAVYVATYPVSDPGLAAPVRLSFVGMAAKVKGPCGEWPDDLASGGSVQGWQNNSYWNFGCANQATLAAQIADPRDLVDPRGETPGDVETRMRAIQKVRQGTDPGTGWAAKAQSRGRQLMSEPIVDQIGAAGDRAANRAGAAHFGAGLLRDLARRRGHRKRGDGPPHAQGACEGPHGRRRRRPSRPFAARRRPISSSSSRSPTAPASSPISTTCRNFATPAPRSSSSATRTTSRSIAMLIARGVSDYIVAPFEVLNFIQHVSHLYNGPNAETLGRVIAVVGAKGGVGASNIAHNLAWSISRVLEIQSVVADLDLAFGTAGLDFNQDPPQGIAEAVFSPERVDANLIDRLLSKCSDTLSLLAAPATLDRLYDLPEFAFDPLLDILRDSTPCTVLDTPHQWTAWTRHILTSADEVVIVANPDLANLRNAKTLVDALRSTRPNDRLPKLLLNIVGVPRRPEIAVGEFAKAIELEPCAIIPFEPKLFGTAANNGQMLAEIEPDVEDRRDVRRSRAPADRARRTCASRRRASGAAARTPWAQEGELAGRVTASRKTQG